MHFALSFVLSAKLLFLLARHSRWRSGSYGSGAKTSASRRYVAEYTFPSLLRWGLRECGPGSAVGRKIMTLSAFSGSEALVARFGLQFRLQSYAFFLIYAKAGGAGVESLEPRVERGSALRPGTEQLRDGGMERRRPRCPSPAPSRERNSLCIMQNAFKLPSRLRRPGAARSRTPSRRRRPSAPTSRGRRSVARRSR